MTRSDSDHKEFGNTKIRQARICLSKKTRATFQVDDKPRRLPSSRSAAITERRGPPHPSARFTHGIVSKPIPSSFSASASSGVASP